MSAAPRRAGARRRALVTALVLALIAPIMAVGVAAPAQAATFRAGMIISDGVFYNAQAMTAAQIQSFLNSKGAGCTAGSVPCLKDYRQTTWTRPADARCTKPYQGANNETAAAIIAKVAGACGVNPQVLLVLLQKEQSLVTASGSYLVPRRYEAATGYGCPDTAPCDAEFKGFYNQVYKAAWAYRNYRLNPYSYGHLAGRTNQIRINPNAACGTKAVYIENQATAGLYNYTPYTPNAATLAGGSDSCSSYGNYNFFKYFTQWFGSTEYPTSGAIGAVWQANQSLLGQAIGPERPGLRGGGVVQSFQNGSVYWTPKLGANIVRGGIMTYWAAQRWEQGGLGYPRTSERALSRLGGAMQSFEGGDVYWSPVGGPQVVLGAVGGRWAAMGRQDGVLGYPVTSERVLAGAGTVQSFESGHIYWAPSTGAHAVRGGIYTWWAARGWEAGTGFPTTDERGLRAGGAVQSFQRIAVYWSPAAGPKGVGGAFLSAYASQGWENGYLGYPTSDAYRSGTTTVQQFEGGRIILNDATGQVSIRPY